MANSILGNNTSRNLPRASTAQRGNPMQMMQQFQQFRNTFRGNPQQIVQQMLQTGQINEAQLQQAMQMARQFQPFVK
jgi:hypothetical protein